MFLILSSTHMTAMIWVKFREMKPEPNHGFYLLRPTWNHIWSGSGLGLVKPETKSSLVWVDEYGRREGWMEGWKEGRDLLVLMLLLLLLFLLFFYIFLLLLSSRQYMVL